VLFWNYGTQVIQQRIIFWPVVDVGVIDSMFKVNDTQITNIVAEVANIRTAQTAQAALATARHETLLIGLYNSRAVHFNGFAVRGDSVLQPLKGVNGNVPANFPATREALFALNVQACNDLLVAYNLPVGDTSRVKKGRLAIHIGLQH